MLLALANSGCGRCAPINLSLSPPPDGSVLDTSELPLLPDASSLSLLGLSRAGVGGRVWNAAKALCEWQLRMKPEIQGSDILELGAGTGCVGLFAARLGATRVVLTDGGPPSLMQLLEYNAQANTNQAVRVLPHRWGDDITGLGSATMDWILASDVTYDDEMHAPLCASLRALLLEGTDARAVLCEEHGPPVPLDGNAALFKDEFLEAFVSTAFSHGLVVEPFELDEDATEVENFSRAWPIADFASGQGYLLEVRLTDVRDVRSEELVTPEA